jgi:pimeloyl-ACP methyl ester carboxylesterase
VDGKFAVREAKILSVGENPIVQCAVWERLRTNSINRTTDYTDDFTSFLPPCFVYIHGDSRSLLDAKEILPIVEACGGILVGFDLPGCGKSSGTFDVSPTVQAQTVASVIQWVNENIKTSQIIIWARCLSTAFLVEYLKDYRKHRQVIKAVVLDTPFTSVKSVVSSVVRVFREKNFPFVPSFLFQPLIWYLRSDITTALGTDPFLISPISHAPSIKVPCAVLSALHDDVVPPEEGRKLCEFWGGPNVFRIFEGSHIGARSKEAVLLPLEFLQTHLDPIPSKVLDSLSEKTPPNIILSPITVGTSQTSKGSISTCTLSTMSSSDSLRDD